jgi:hypothetical protein
VSQWALQYQWQFNGADIPGATNEDLTITNATASNTGKYQAIARATFDNTHYWFGSRIAEVKVGPQVPIHFNAPVLQPDGSFIVTASTTNGIAQHLTDPSVILVQQSTDLINWIPLTNGWTLTNGAIQFQGAGNSSEFYRLAAP